MSLRLSHLPTDLLNAIAYYLPPRDRLNLACTSSYIYIAVWARHALPDILHRFPLERRTTFSLQVNLCPTTLRRTSKSSSLRSVPSRSRQQHLNVSVNPTGTLVAVLPYDNLLRLICPRRAQVVATYDIPVFSNDVWDDARVERRPCTRPPDVVYAEDAGLDIETCVDFSADGKALLVVSRDAVRYFAVRYDNSVAQSTTPELELRGTLHLADALARVMEASPRSTASEAASTATMTSGSGGAAALSPDGKHLAWVVFAQAPATVHVTLWGRVDGQGGNGSAYINDGAVEWRHVRTVEADRVWTRRWAALAWARPIFTPNSRILLLVVNCAHKVTRVVNVDGEFQRTKLCRFELLRVSVPSDHQSHGGGGSARAAATSDAVVRRSEWLDLATDVYPRLLAQAVVRMLNAEKVHEIGGRFGDASGKAVVWQARKQVFRMPGIAFNSVHSCPAEATYKGLLFRNARHPWYVSKQPMFSFHFSPCGARVVVATSPHNNIMRTLEWGKDGRGGPAAEDGSLEDREVGGRWFGFRRMPWREAFSAVTAFSTSGQWLAGAALLDDDRCCVCVRNVTLREYFGEQGPPGEAMLGDA